LPNTIAFEAEFGIKKLKGHKSPGTDQMPAGLIKAGIEEFAMRSRNLLILFGLKRNCLSSKRSQSFTYL
jgi:hypothetical protein